MAERGPTAEHRIVLLTGKDSFLRVEWSRRLRDALEAKHGEISEFAFDGAAAPLATVLDELRSYGLMATHKLVVVDNADAFFAVEERRRAMERYAEAPMEEATLLLRTQNWRPGNFDKLVAKVGVILKCEPPSQDEAARWCLGRAQKQHRMPIDQGAAATLVDRIGSDLARLDTELAKLAAAASAAGKAAIDRATVIDLVGISREEQAWEIQEAILSGKPPAAAEKVVELLRVSRAPEVLVSWAIIDLFRKIHAAAALQAQGVSDSQVARELKLWGASVSPVLASAHRLGLTRAAALQRRAVAADFAMKSGGAADPERALIGLCTIVAGELGTESAR